MTKKSLFIERRFGDLNPYDVLEFEPMVVRMADGEYVAAGVAELEDGSLCLSMPFNMVSMYDEVGEMTGYSFAKYCPGSDDAFFLLEPVHVHSLGNMSTKYHESYDAAVDKLLDIWANEASELEAEAASMPDDDEPTGVVLPFKRDTIH